MKLIVESTSPRRMRVSPGSVPGPVGAGPGGFQSRAPAGGPGDAVWCGVFAAHGLAYLWLVFCGRFLLSRAVRHGTWPGRRPRKTANAAATAARKMASNACGQLVGAFFANFRNGAVSEEPSIATWPGQERHPFGGERVVETVFGGLLAVLRARPADGLFSSPANPPQTRSGQLT